MVDAQRAVRAPDERVANFEHAVVNVVEQPTILLFMLLARDLLHNIGVSLSLFFIGKSSNFALLNNIITFKFY